MEWNLRMLCSNRAPVLGRPLEDVVAWHALDAGNVPLVTAEDRAAPPVCDRGLRQHAGLHGHLVLDDDFLAADRLRDAGQCVADPTLTPLRQWLPREMVGD
jgi:hypothetical protein